ncbi:putative acyl-CoA transferase/carnitine dehydratase [Pyrobaculum sp. WP30]|nr:putative acyl-CoA transferase/carnitine dehydratase [Pyrobaculum sp. WP30]
MRVLELSTLFPVSLAGRLLLQLGFEVVKVEPPAGDPIRQVSPTLYKVLNEGEEIIYIDLKDGAEKVRRLAEEVDAVLTTFRPSTAERYGISYRRLAETKPDLIYVAIVGYGGEEYPRGHPSHDINFAALAGAVGPCPPYVQAVDVAAGLLAALTITAMAAKGEGGYVEIPMSRAAALVNILNLSLRRDGKPLLLSGDYPFYTVYRYTGGRVALGAVEPKFWERFCRAIGREHLIPRQLDPTARKEVEKVLSEMDCNALEELAKREEIPLTPVYDIDKALTIFELDNLFKLF